MAAICCLLTFILSTIAYASSAQWDLDPISGDWNTPGNWTPITVPNGPADTATFGLSHTTDVSISANTEVNAITFTPAATNLYTITASHGFVLTLSGTGITNNSGMAHVFATAVDGEIRFTHNATAAGSFIFNESGGKTNFFGSSTATGAEIDNADGGATDGGTTNFFGNSTAGTITNEGSGTTNFFNNSTAGGPIMNLSGEELGGTTNFYNHSTAGSAHIHNDPASSTLFFDSSSAGNAQIDTDAGNGFVFFGDNSTAANAGIFITDNSGLVFAGSSSAGNAFIGFTGQVEFSESSTAGSALIAGDAGFVSFDGSSRGGAAQIELGFDFFLLEGGALDISFHNAPGITIGSLAGDEGTTVVLGANNLTVGSNNLSTTFAGVIEDGFFGVTGGSLTKIGSGTLILSGANSYTGNTNVNGGVLQVDGSITSNAFVNQRGTLAGTGTVNGNVVNNGRVSPGGMGSAGLLTVIDSYTQAQTATLMIQIAAANTSDFSVLNVLGNANLNGLLDPVLLDGFVPSVGDSFVFLNYASFTGEFAHIKDRVFDDGMLQWSVIYEDKQAILTVAQHTPDQASTFLLLTLGLLGLMTCRRQLPH